MEATQAAGSHQRPLGVWSRVRREAGLLAILAVALVYALNAWTPSHYEEGLAQLGLPGAGLILGKSDAIRSDEWAVMTPMFQIAVANDLGPRDEMSPYRESLTTFFALPSRDWSMAFKPDLWGFLVLDPVHAFSLHYAVLGVAMLVGFTLLLRQLGCTPGFALAVSALLFMSQFVQLWWTSNAAHFAFAPWAPVIYLWRAPWPLRLPLLAYAVAALLIGLLYPPFLIGAGLAFAVLLLAFRPDALKPTVLLPSLVAIAVGVGLAGLHFGELIAVMRATVYPGQRLADGGGVPAAWLAAHFLPYLTTDGFDPMPVWLANACEISVIGSFLPLAIFVFADHRALLSWIRRRRWASAIWLGGLGLMLVWMTVPIPAAAAPVLNQVPPLRMLWGFGLLLILGLGVVGSQVRWVVDAARVGVFLLLAVAGWALSKLTPWRGTFGEFDLILIPAFVIAWLVCAIATRRRLSRATVMLALAITSATTFARFNPIQSARPIFERQESQTLTAFRAYVAANPHKWLVVSSLPNVYGVYGAFLNGAGLPAINHTLTRPQLAFFKAAYPDLSPAELDEIFNRYAHIAPAMGWRPTVPQPDLIALPPDRFAIPMQVELGGGGGRSVTVDQFEAVRLDANHWGVTATGWAPWAAVAGDQRLGVRLADPRNGRIVSAGAYRLPRPDVATSLKNPSLFAAGFGARIEIETSQPLAELPATSLIFTGLGAIEP